MQTLEPSVCAKAASRFLRSPADKRNKLIDGAYLAEGVYPLSQGCGLVR